MIKTILPSSYGYQDQLSSLVDVHSKGVDGTWMNKRAAAGIFKDADIRPVKDHSFIHLIAMGDTETWGSNRNADAFMKQATTVEVPQPEKGKSKFLKVAKGNVETHSTFLTHGAVFFHHKNKDPKQAHGTIEKSAHSDDMSRVELIIKVPNSEWHDDLEKLASGGDLAFSMSCKIPYDSCSVCAHQAKTRREYCVHLKEHLGEITKEGVHVSAINDHMCYFDISKVVVPADRTAFGLLKVASAADSAVIGGAELAEQMFPLGTESDDLLLASPRNSKLAMIRKLSEIEKQIESSAPASSSINKCINAFDPEVSGDIPEAEISKLTPMRSETSDVLGALADVKISLTIKDFLQILLGKRFGEVAEHVDEAKGMLPGIFSRMTKQPASSVDAAKDFDLSDGVIPRQMRETIQGLIGGHSLDDDPVSRRITITVLRGKSPLKPATPVDMEKKSGKASMIAERMATAYAAYKVAFCQRMSEDDGALIERAVLQNYV